MKIEITAGNLRQNHFYLTGHLDDFPKDVIGGANSEDEAAPRRLRLKWPFGDPVITDIAGDKKIFRQRGWVRKLFAQSNAEPGDFVVLKAVTPYEYEVHIEKRAGTGKAPILERVDEDDEPNGTLMKSKALNTILYGPPGTGKTFRTAELAVQICDGRASGVRDEVMDRYEALRQGGRISFVTFHQSYGYEDFVEGLRPESIGGQISYPVRHGVLRQICDTARLSRMARPGLSGKPLKERTFYKMSLGRSGTIEGSRVFQDCIENGYVLLGWGDDADFSECRSAADVRRVVAQELAQSGDKQESQARYVQVFKNDMQVGDIVIVPQGNSDFRAIAEVTGDYEYLEEPAVGRYHQMRRVRWLAILDDAEVVNVIFDRNFMQSALYRLDREGLRFDALQRLIDQQLPAAPQNFVLIVDEINRANISKVFGELITLLEPDKREGEVNALTVKLPCSGDDFAVPPNLYIVGTMNTADRSIALLDTALRRRFEFEEMQPDYGALPSFPDIDLAALLASLNERVEYLYDRDHAIGHAYFMHVASLQDLDTVFRRKVIPLLQEYFYEDWSKIRLVLNDREGLFVDARTAVPKGLEIAADGFEPRPRYRMRSEPFPLDAYLNIYR
ncbi:AAA family ATPase [Herbaspirillum sp. SJZ107]|uniref:AAA family ATPase n=1 Tax=Herbaspirillum sp. SJZ107 TaxID=2572881 RepID=UPI00114FCC1E|nr:AAA family ATPase [Herbaspirillum sp. SJZ107]TQK03468.1 dynein-related subfamily AAA family protein [Herbaspirillum sp. SJZ107]